mmetsp:Transcript_4640/g.7454  ORF Transcript_4640/g.7454 Transcript_4640/m.7454 type:complete len:84 (-) Transcript_4640:201-452(-)
MNFPIRCYGCGKVIANRIETFLQLRNEGVPEEIIFERMKLPPTKWCCRRFFLTYCNTDESLLRRSDISRKECVKYSTAGKKPP